MTDHYESAKKFLKEPSKVDWHDETLWWVRKKRDRAAGEVDEWEELREAASNIKERALAELDSNLMEIGRAHV